MPTISIAEPLEINAIVWITSLEVHERGPTRRMLEDLTDQSQAGGFPVIERPVDDRAELFDVLDQLAIRAAKGLRPILHFGTHGNAKDGISLLPSDEWASWAELMDRLRAINVATKNNLVVVFGLCCGLNPYKLVELKQPTPAYLFAAADKIINTGFLEAQVPPFYKQAQADGAFLAAFEATLGKQMQLMNCQGLFLSALAHYVKTACQGEVLEARIAKTVAGYFQRNNIVSRRPNSSPRWRRGFAPPWSRANT